MQNINEVLGVKLLVKYSNSKLFHAKYKKYIIHVQHAA